MIDLPFGTTETATVRTPTVAIDITGGGDGGGLLDSVGAAAGLGGGSPDAWREALVSLTLDAALLPGVDVVTIELANDPRAPAVALGDSGAIGFGFGDETEPAFTGQVDTVKRRLAGGRRVTLVNGGALLARQRLDMSFQDQTAGEIVEALLGAVDPAIAAGTVEDGISYPFYAVDSGRTLLQHIADLARRSGHVAYFTPENELFFEPAAEEDPAHEFIFAQDIIALRIEEREPLLNSALATGEGAASTGGSDAWPWLVKDAGAVQAETGDEQPQALIADGSLRSGDAATTAASAALAGQITQAGYILSSGAPTVRTGSTITIAGVPDDSLNGTFFVRRVRHRFDKRNGYQTELWFSQLPEGGGLLGGLF
jgi:hypothetical protein